MAERALRICLVTPRFAPYVGGVETHVHELGVRFARSGNSVDVVTVGRRDDELPDTQELDGVTVRRVPAPRVGGQDGLSPALIYAVRESSADVVHAHNYHSAAPIAAALGTRHRPLVVTPHYHGEGSTRLASAAHRVYRPSLGRALMRRADAVLSVSRSEANLVRRHFGTSVAARTTVIPNGVSPVADWVGSGGDDVRMVYIGRLAAYKNVELLIRAVAVDRRLSLVVAGDGPDRERLSAIARGAGIARRVSFEGQVSAEQRATLLRTADVYVTASSREAFGLTLADAVASGLPAVASAIPAHQDVHAAAFGPDAPGPLMLVPIGGDVDRLAAEFAMAVRSVAASTRVGRPPDLPIWDDVAKAVLARYDELLRQER
jgi:glycosyltransferase involved in cell wall biosynthesis